MNIYQNNVKKVIFFSIFWSFDLENDLVANFYYHIRNQRTKIQKIV